MLRTAALHSSPSYTRYSSQIVQWPTGHSGSGCGTLRPSSATLVLLRHGQSDWNLQNRFTGWANVPLTQIGLAEAAAAGLDMVNAGLKFDRVLTSKGDDATLDAVRSDVVALCGRFPMHG